MTDSRLTALLFESTGVVGNSVWPSVQREYNYTASDFCCSTYRYSVHRFHLIKGFQNDMHVKGHELMMKCLLVSDFSVKGQISTKVVN